MVHGEEEGQWMTINTAAAVVRRRHCEKGDRLTGWRPNSQATPGMLPQRSRRFLCLSAGDASTLIQVSSGAVPSPVSAARRKGHEGPDNKNIKLASRRLTLTSFLLMMVNPAMASCDWKYIHRRVNIISTCYEDEVPTV